MEYHILLCLRWTTFFLHFPWLCQDVHYYSDAVGGAWERPIGLLGRLYLLAMELEQGEQSWWCVEWVWFHWCDWVLMRYPRPGEWTHCCCGDGVFRDCYSSSLGTWYRGVWSTWSGPGQPYDQRESSHEGCAWGRETQACTNIQPYLQRNVACFIYSVYASPSWCESPLWCTVARSGYYNNNVHVQAHVHIYTCPSTPSPFLTLVLCHGTETWDESDPLFCSSIRDKNALSMHIFSLVCLYRQKAPEYKVNVSCMKMVSQVSKAITTVWLT